LAVSPDTMTRSSPGKVGKRRVREEMGGWEGLGHNVRIIA